MQMAPVESESALFVPELVYHGEEGYASSLASPLDPPTNTNVMIPWSDDTLMPARIPAAPTATFIAPGTVCDSYFAAEQATMSSSCFDNHVSFSDVVGRLLLSYLCS